MKILPLNLSLVATNIATDSMPENRLKLCPGEYHRSTRRLQLLRRSIYQKMPKRWLLFEPVRQRLRFGNIQYIMGTTMRIDVCHEKFQHLIAVPSDAATI